jgi:hypothetical protein
VTPCRNQMRSCGLSEPKAIERFSKTERGDMHCTPRGWAILELGMYDRLKETFGAQPLHP